jgi:hypothetical protein
VILLHADQHVGVCVCMQVLQYKKKCSEFEESQRSLQSEMDRQRKVVILQLVILSCNVYTNVCIHCCCMHRCLFCVTLLVIVLVEMSY